MHGSKVSKATAILTCKANGVNGPFSALIAIQTSYLSVCGLCLDKLYTLLRGGNISTAALGQDSAAVAL